MAVSTRSQDSKTTIGDSFDVTDQVVTACRTRPGRVVFTEAGNTDGWIATDLTIEPRA